FKAVIQSKIRTLNTKSHRTAVWFTSGNLLTAGISAMSGLLYGRWIAPVTLGEFNKYGILTGYLGLGIVLVDGAFQRHLPYFLGRGEQEQALEIASIAKWWYSVLVYLGVVIFGILSISAAVRSDLQGFLGWVGHIPLYAMSTYG